MFNSCTGGGVKIANLRQLSIPSVFLSMLLHVGEQCFLSLSLIILTQ